MYLAHELRDDTVESRSLVAEAMLSCAERSEVLCKTHSQREFMCTGVDSKHYHNVRNESRGRSFLLFDYAISFKNKTKNIVLVSS